MTKQSPQKQQHVINDLITMPDDGKRNELINGEIIEMAICSLKHTVLGSWLVRVLGNYVAENNLGGYVNGPDATYKLDESNLRAPNLSYLSAASITKLLPDTVFCPFAPDFAILIRSLSQKAITRRRLAQDYLKAGTHLVWIVDLKDEHVLVYHLDQPPLVFADEDILDGEGVLPGFTVKPSEIFAAINEIP